MATSVNKRVLLLRTHLSMTQQEFASMVGLTSTQLSRIEGGSSIPHKSTLEKIISNSGVDREWFMTGKGELIVHEVVSKSASNPWQDATYRELKDQYSVMKDEANKWYKEYQNMREMVSTLLAKANLGKLSAPSKTAVIRFLKAAEGARKVA